MPTKDATVRVACVVMPDGSVQYTTKGTTSINAAVKNWHAALPDDLRKEHEDKKTGGGVVVCTMLARDFMAIPKVFKP